MRANPEGESRRACARMTSTLALNISTASRVRFGGALSSWSGPRNVAAHCLDGILHPEDIYERFAWASLNLSRADGIRNGCGPLGPCTCAPAERQRLEGFFSSLSRLRC
jgi:hypothetical protein